MNRFIPVIMLAVLPAACFSVPPPKAFNPSAFYNQTTLNSLQELVLRLVDENSCKREMMASTGESSGSGSNGFHGTRNLHQDLRGTADSADKLMRALQSELEKLARASGATIDETGQGGGAGDRLVGFEFGYTIANTHGQVEANLEGGGPDAKKQEQHYKLSLRIQEWVR